MDGAAGGGNPEVFVRFGLFGACRFCREQAPEFQDLQLVHLILCPATFASSLYMFDMFKPDTCKYKYPPKP